MELRVFQVFYDRQQTPLLDNGFIPYYNERKTELFENEIIKDIYLNKKYKGADYTGITSWRIAEKTGLTSSKIAQRIRNSKADIYLYGNVRREGHMSNLLRESRFEFNGEIIQRAYDKEVLKFKNPELKWVTVFCNYWICKPEIFEKYCSDFLMPMLQFLKEDFRSRSLLENGIYQHRGVNYPRHPFVLELLFGLFVYHHSSKFKIDFIAPETPLPANILKKYDIQMPSVLPIEIKQMEEAKPADKMENVDGKVLLSETMHRKTKKIIGFYHIYAVNNWLEIVLEQLWLMARFGLYDAADAIYVGFIGGENELSIFRRLILQFPKIKIGATSEHAPDYEFVTQRIIVNHAIADNFYGFYLHTKGATSEIIIPWVRYWRNCLNHYTISRWAWNVEMLNKGHNTSGVQYKDFVPGFPPHYSGNYFWFDSPLIKTAHPLTAEFCTDRFNAERWLSTTTGWKPANFKTLHEFTSELCYLPETAQYDERAFLKYELQNGTTIDNPDYSVLMDLTCKKIIDFGIQTAFDIGSGTGALVNRLNTKYGVNAIGVDPSLQHYLFATNPQRCPPGLEKKYVVATLDSINTWADMFICIEVLEHIDHQQSKTFLLNAANNCRYFYFSSTPYSANTEQFDVEWGHINVKPTTLWVKLFEDCGFELYKFVDAPTAWSMIFISIKNK